MKEKEELWPALPYEAWKDTYATLHMWTQIVGKVALAQAPLLNHSWAIAMQVTPRGLSTRTLPHGDRTFSIQFDFIDHQLVIRASDDETRTLPLRPQTVADFYREIMATLDGMGLPVKIWPMPVELQSPIRVDLDTVHHSYDPVYANRCWRILSQAARVLTASQCKFVGKCSPVHFFWGAFDLAVTRFSGRRAPPREGPAFMREAYSHEVISHGFWPGSGPLLEPTFYAYAAPEPPGLKDARVQPDAAYYHHELSEFVLPYEAVRNAASPDQAILTFVESTYDRAATLADWDRAVESGRNPRRPRPDSERQSRGGRAIGAAGYGLAAYRYGLARVAHVLTPELLYACIVLSLLYLVTTGSVTMIVAARVKSSRAAQQIAGLVIALSAALFAGLGFVASQVGEGWPLLGLGVGLVVLDVLALELARRVWQREEVIGRV